MPLLRPTKEELEIALLVTRPGAAIGPNVACVLKTEVLALREELQAMRLERDQLKVDVAECELILVREGILCRGDIEQ